MNLVSKESYKHKYAKDVLASWLKNHYIKIELEREFSMLGFICFIPDLVCYDENGVKDMFEVVHKNSVSMIKQWKMYVYFKIHNWNINVYEIDAEWIMKQIEVPKTLQTVKIL